MQHDTLAIANAEITNTIGVAIAQQLDSWIPGKFEGTQKLSGHPFFRTAESFTFASSSCLSTHAETCMMITFGRSFRRPWPGSLFLVELHKHKRDYSVCVAGLGKTAQGLTRDSWLFGTSYGGVLLKKAYLVLVREPDFAEVASKATTHI